MCLIKALARYQRLGVPTTADDKARGRVPIHTILLTGVGRDQLRQNPHENF